MIDPADAAMIVGFIVNRFRGDPSLFDDGMTDIARRTGWPALGLVPFFDDAHRLPAEDALGLRTTRRGARAVRIVVLAYPRIANFDDFDPLRLEPGVDLVFLRPGAADARRRRAGHPAGLEGDHRRPRRACARPAGTSTCRRICGAAAACWASAAATRCSAAASPIRTASKGRRRRSTASACSTVDTVLEGDKVLVEVCAARRSGVPFKGYEMHIGRTTGSADGRCSALARPRPRAR